RRAAGALGARALPRARHRDATRTAPRRRRARRAARRAGAARRALRAASACPRPSRLHGLEPARAGRPAPPARLSGRAARTRRLRSGRAPDRPHDGDARRTRSRARAHRALPRRAPLTDATPKPLLPVAGRPFLEHILDFLRAAGIRDVVLNLHHLGRRIEEHLGDGARFGLRVRYSWENPILDTGGGIKRAEP